MKVYIAIRFWTPNELGGLGSLTDCEVFKTEEEAVNTFVKNQKEENLRKTNGEILNCTVFPMIPNGNLTK